MTEKERQLVFLKESLLKIKETGTIVETSKITARKIVKKSFNHKEKTIVELGAGTGVVTKEILKLMNPKQELISFEINYKFCYYLRKIPDKRLKIINDSAENLSKYIKKKTSCIISVLPLAVMDKEIKFRILKEVENNLSKNGKFAQLQYIPFEYKNLKSHFDKVELDFSLFNIPPAFFYICTKV